jgi:hypothetical protein
LIQDHAAFTNWLRSEPLQWSIVIAVRAALRTLPVADLSTILATFRALAIARFSAKYPDSALDGRYMTCAAEAAAFSAKSAASVAAALAASTAHRIAGDRTSGDGDGAVYLHAAEAVALSLSAATQAGYATEHLASIVFDMRLLAEGTVSFGQLVDLPLWQDSQPSRLIDHWQSLTRQLREDGHHWSVWISWYEDHLVAVRRTTELEDAAFTDIPEELPWDEGIEAVNTEIVSRLEAMLPDPKPIEDISSPITINRMPDGRIGVEAGPFSLPTLPAPLTPKDHHNTLTACRNRAVQIAKIASSPQFQGRSEYAQILDDYLDWLPGEQGTGNMLLADGEARTLNKLFTAEEGILPAVFASKLAVLLEDHIALRSFYPEVERHYHAVNTGRLIKPLSRDAVEAIQKIIRSQTPKIFNETVSPAVDEAAKPAPDFQPISGQDLPPADPNRPKPPHDPIADADPRKSRNYIIASAYNRIWAILQKGKGTADAIEGWQKTYNLLKPHIGPIIDFLQNFWPGDGSGGPPLPPTIGA